MHPGIILGWPYYQGIHGYSDGGGGGGGGEWEVHTYVCILGSSQDGHRYLGLH